MITLKFNGYMASVFDCGELYLAVSTVKELFQAIRANFPSFAQYLVDAAQRGLNYQISVNGRIVPAHAIEFLLPQDGVVIVLAVPSGAGGKGFRIIAGVALLALGGFGVGFLGFKASTVAITGAALLFSAFRSQQKPPGEATALKSNIFSGAETSGKEGDAYPVVYGLHLTGWLLASQRSTTTYKAA